MCRLRKEWALDEKAIGHCPLPRGNGLVSERLYSFVPTDEGHGVVGEDGCHQGQTYAIAARVGVWRWVEVSGRIKSHRETLFSSNMEIETIDGRDRGIF